MLGTDIFLLSKNDFVKILVYKIVTISKVKPTYVCLSFQIELWPFNSTFLMCYLLKINPVYITQFQSSKHEQVRFNKEFYSVNYC